MLSDSLQPHGLQWTEALQAPLCMGFPRQEYWSVLPLPSPGDLPDPGMEPESPVSPALQADSVFLPGEFHGQRSLARYIPWGLKESDATTG